jgi:hypothetical protein
VGLLDAFTSTWDKARETYGLLPEATWLRTHSRIKWREKNPT